jgi:hypothetical protein
MPATSAVVALLPPADTNPDTNPGESVRTVTNNPSTQISMISGAAHSGEQWRTSSYHTSKPVIAIGAWNEVQGFGSMAGLSA